MCIAIAHLPTLVGPELSIAGRSSIDRMDAAPYATAKRRERVIFRTCDDTVLNEVVVKVREMPLEVFGAPNFPAPRSAFARYLVVAGQALTSCEATLRLLPPDMLS